jgi:hypothetical protein
MGMAALLRQLHPLRLLLLLRLLSLFILPPPFLLLLLLAQLLGRRISGVTKRCASLF